MPRAEKERTDLATKEPPPNCVPEIINCALEQ